MEESRILVLDFGSQYSHIIVRRCRSLKIYTELKRCDTPISEIKSFNPGGIILSGGPYSVFEKEAPHVCPEFWKHTKDEGIRVLGICYGLQEMCYALGGEVGSALKREYGSAELKVRDSNSPLLQGVTAASEVWMSHGDKVLALPKGFKPIGTTSSSEFCVVANEQDGLYGLQFHPEVSHTKEGMTILKNFCHGICKLPGNWSMKSFFEHEMVKLRHDVGNRHVIGAMSGGVDSTVAAALVHQAIGDKFIGIMIDTGMLRQNEGVEVIKTLNKLFPALRVDVHDCSDHFLAELAGVTDPEEKRKIIGRCFIECFEKIAKDASLPLEESLLLQGTLYPDIIESVSFKGPSVTIKSHHNVGGLPAAMKLTVLEPLRELFKDEVRALGEEMGLPHDCVWRHPFPGPGLGIRIMGDVTRTRANTLRQADAIFIEEIRASGDYEKIAQAFVVLMPTVQTVGVMGDQRTYDACCAIRAVTSSDFMTADWYPMPYDLLARISNRIVNEVKGINRCTYDVTSKPPGTIEWE
eukprot:Platyproteum_vivax@DN14043_c0_g1_i1.p1